MRAGGIEKHVEMLGLELVKMGHEVFVYTRPYYTDRRLTEYKGIHLISLPTIKSKNLDAIFHSFLATMHVLFCKADIIHYQGIGPSMLLWIPKLFKRHAKIFSTLHSDDRQHDKWSRFAKFMLGLGARVACKFADTTIAISKFQKEMFMSEFGGDIVYIPNGVTIQKSLEPHEIHSKWGIGDKDYILFVSRFVRHKGLHYLIEAYNQIQNPTKKLVVVGGSAYTDDYVNEIHALAKHNQNIIFTGFVGGSTMEELYSNAFLYVIPSEYEGLSIALLEVMSYGTPVLASDIPPNREALGGLGFTFSNKNVDDLHSALSYLLNHEQEVAQSGKALQDRVAEEYDWGRIAEKTVEEYKKL